jgi:Ca-activated chloride channel family protein
MARKAVDHALRLLAERDRLAVVCYDHEVDVLLGCAPASGESKALAAARLNSIDARGNTDLAAGWAKGAAEIAPPAGAVGDEISRVLLLSDGLANAGETNADVLAERADELRNQGVTTSTFGVGADFDERLMSRVATMGGGHFYFIEQAAQIPDFFTSELGDTLQIVARDARLVVFNAPGTETVCLNDFPTAMHDDGLHIRLGDLSAGDCVTLVLATTLAPASSGTAPSLRTSR